jgi:hypothetical protein
MREPLFVSITSMAGFVHRCTQLLVLRRLCFPAFELAQRTIFSLFDTRHEMPRTHGACRDTVCRNTRRDILNWNTENSAAWNCVCNQSYDISRTACKRFLEARPNSVCVSGHLPELIAGVIKIDAPCTQQHIAAVGISGAAEELESLTLKKCGYAGWKLWIITGDLGAICIGSAERNLNTL